MLFVIQLTIPPPDKSSLSIPASTPGSNPFRIITRNLLRLKNLCFNSEVGHLFGHAIAFMAGVDYTYIRRKRGGFSGNRVLCLFSLVAMTATMGVEVGTLSLGDATIEDSEFVVPVLLNVSEEAVAALDFRLEYDSQTIEPVAAQAGPSALQAGKEVTANVSAPGTYIVVVMGLSKSVLRSGEVARLVLRRVPGAMAGPTTLSISKPTFSTWEGIPLPAEGSSRIFAPGRTAGQKSQPIEKTPVSSRGEGEASNHAGAVEKKTVESKSGEVYNSDSGERTFQTVGEQNHHHPLRKWSIIGVLLIGLGLVSLIVLRRKLFD